MFPELRAAVAQRAREIWLSRGMPENQDLDIWLEAEREIVDRYKVIEQGHKRTDSVKHRTSSVAADEIDETQLSERLSDFGDPGRRSPTSVEPT